MAERLETAGETDDAAVARERATRAEVESATILAAADATAPDHPALVEFLFTEALTAEDWETCQHLATRAARLNTDKAGGLIFKGRFELAQQQNEQAVRTLTSATDRMHFSSLAWRLLGRAHENLGNFDSARRSYEEAYRCNPNDRFAVRWYVGLLRQIGDDVRALLVLRQARLGIQNDPVFVDAWLEMEAAVGEAALAVRERRSIYKKTPDNRLNAMRLVAFLSQAKPNREFVQTPAGTPRYTESEWKFLTAGERECALNGVSAAWASECDEILASLLSGAS